MKSAKRFLIVCFTALWGAAVLDTAQAEPRLVGLITDYQPRVSADNTSAIEINRNAKRLPVRDHELLYEGDVIAFGDRADAKAFVKVMTDAETEVILHRGDKIPSRGSAILQTLFPRLVAVSRWVKLGTSTEGSDPVNAISRDPGGELSSIVALPNHRGKLIISDDDNLPLWIGWSGGMPPFTVSVGPSGEAAANTVICESTPQETCVREAELNLKASGSKAIQLTVKSANGMSWTETVERAPLPSTPAFSEGRQLEKLGPFLNATELLDKGRGTYVLESARELAAIARDYPAARTILDNIREGQIP